ncbi:uncharacterized protein I303_100912 [Kwoniella dejecticola CBS 10117]|uniref:Uncharacterized protein n=1 Tax=Kwoniella dejecticola CBS 10117 TaxID=1296121 RepID=A0A1A6AGA7_9TREE|nr:uncharacterized protein I303_00916 [Kwoniella dejecticola CBS 10117]OBR89094.1 hypothetical protein I303_00916 [Kwoniella dejecticola CBS 10117]
MSSDITLEQWKEKVKKQDLQYKELEYRYDKAVAAHLNNITASQRVVDAAMLPPTSEEIKPDISTYVLDAGSDKHRVCLEGAGDCQPSSQEIPMPDQLPAPRSPDDHPPTDHRNTDGSTWSDWTIKPFIDMSKVGLSDPTAIIPPEMVDSCYIYQQIKRHLKSEMTQDQIEDMARWWTSRLVDEDDIEKTTKDQLLYQEWIGFVKVMAWW